MTLDQFLYLADNAQGVVMHVHGRLTAQQAMALREEEERRYQKTVWHS